MVQLDVRQYPHAKLLALVPLANFCDLKLRACEWKKNPITKEKEGQKRCGAVADVLHIPVRIINFITKQARALAVGSLHRDQEGAGRAR